MTREEFLAKYPAACRSCNASGEVHYSENGAPHGAGYWPMDVVEPCPHCYDLGICPRCGTANYDEWVSDEIPCPVCNWEWGVEDILPPLPVESTSYWTVKQYQGYLTGIALRPNMDYQTYLAFADNAALLHDVQGWWDLARKTWAETFFLPGVNYE